MGSLGRSAEIRVPGPDTGPPITFHQFISDKTSQEIEM